MQNIDRVVAGLLLQSKSIKLQPTNPFTWASGWKSPIYCDNRNTLSYPEIRDTIKEAFALKIKELYPETEIIAGVATGAIAQAALVADALSLPMIYVRPEPKKHGMGNQIEGQVPTHKKVLVIEDLISTGMSSLKAVDALRKSDAEVLGMLAIFTYGFQKASDNFEAANCQINTLSNYDFLLEEALQTKYIESDQLEILKQWRLDPSNWMQS